jgi:hypothetical protein
MVMWFISVEAVCFMLSYAPLEAKLWILQTFFGHRYGTLLCWFIYQVSLERGSLRMITYNNAYDKSFWTCAMEYAANIPLGMIPASTTAYLGRTVMDVFGQICRAGRSYGLISAKKASIPLTSSWEIVN